MAVQRYAGLWYRAAEGGTEAKSGQHRGSMDFGYQALGRFPLLPVWVQRRAPIAKNAPSESSRCRIMIFFLLHDRGDIEKLLQSLAS